MSKFERAKMANKKIDEYIRELQLVARDKGNETTKDGRSYLRSQLKKEMEKPDAPLLRMEPAEMKNEVSKIIPLATQVDAFKTSTLKRQKLGVKVMESVVDHLRDHHEKQGNCLIVPFC